MKHLLKKCLFVLFFIPVLSFAQKTHTVGPKETLFSIGRLYNVHPRELAAFNNIPFEQGLTLGQVINIPKKTTMQPLAKTPASNENTTTSTPATEQKAATPPAAKPIEKRSIAEVLTPIYHVVQKKENLFQIRMQYNKVPMDSLKKWNHLTSDAVNEGTNLIVGYKKVSSTAIETIPSPTVKTESTPITTPTSIQKSSNEPKVVVETKETNNKQPELNTTETVAIATPAPGSRKYPDGGFFKAQFQEQSKSKSAAIEESGKAGQFKSTSGWDDGMYYCLHNKAIAGTIVKIINKATKRFVFAKVLDVIPDINKNSDLTISISKAAAEELGATSDTFDVTINY